MIEIKKPNMLEVEQIMALSPQALFEGTLGRAKPSHEKIKKLVDPILEKGGYYLIATEDDQLKGWILIGASKDQFTDSATGFIYELYVLKPFRGQGISKLLMKSAIDELKLEGYPEVRLSAFAGNHAIQLYEKMGFAIRNITMSLPL